MVTVTLIRVFTKLGFLTLIRVLNVRRNVMYTVQVTVNIVILS